MFYNISGGISKRVISIFKRNVDENLSNAVSSIIAMDLPKFLFEYLEAFIKIPRLHTSCISVCRTSYFDTVIFEYSEDQNVRLSWNSTFTIGIIVRVLFA